MKTTLAVLVLLVAGGTVYTQNLRPTAAPELPALPGVPAAPALQPSAAQPKERTITQLLDEIHAVRAQKAELEKKEQALMAEARKMMDKLNERLNKMGLGAPMQPTTPAFDAPAGLPPGGIVPPNGPGLPPLPR